MVSYDLAAGKPTSLVVGVVRCSNRQDRMGGINYGKVKKSMLELY